MTKFVTVEIFGRPIVLSDSVKAFGFHGPVEMDVKDIFKCLVNNANVTEIIPGTRETHKLTLQNYNKGFDMSSNPVIEKKEEAKPIVNEVKPEPVIEDKKEDDPTTTLTSEIAEATPSSSEFIHDEDKSKGEQKPVLDNQQKQYYNKGKNKNYRR